MTEKMALSERMRQIRKKDTKPELTVRRVAHGRGYRFRLHGARLPSTPDLIFTVRKKVIFVHGCFWHQHDCKLGDKRPKQNAGYWLPKLARNVERDRENLANLRAMGWEALIVWECETSRHLELANRISAFLGATLHVE